MRRFEFVDGKSNKFWEAKTEGPKLLVRFGRIGGTWQESDKLLANAEKANAEMEKLIREKTRKGYLEVGGKPKVKVLAKAVAKKAKPKEPKPQSMEATISPAERKAKAQKVLLMFANGQWELAHNILEIAQDEEWLFEQLLNGCKIEEGKPIPSNAIKKAFKNDEKNCPVLAMLNIMLCIPDGSKLLKTFNFEKLKELDFGAVEGEEMRPWIVHVLRLLPRSEISVVLYGLTSLSDAAAEALSKHEGELDLSGLESLSDSPGRVVLAAKLASQKGDLDLSGLESLSDAVAEALSKHRGELKFRNLTSLNDSPGHVALARKLASQKGGLDLGWLKSLGDAVAEALSKHRGELKFRNLTSLNDSPGHVALAEKLASQKDVLWLYGLKSLSDAAAEALSKHKGDLNLGSYKLTSQNDSLGYVALARKLVSQKGGSYYFLSLSDTAAEAFSKHKGGLSLKGLTHLSDAAAESLSRHKGDLDLFNLTNLSDSPEHVALAQKLASQKVLHFGRLKSLSDAAAEALGKLKGFLGFIDLTTLSDSAAEALSNHKGNLNLPGLTILSDAAVEALSKHKGRLGLDGLTYLSDTAAESLSKHKGDLDLYGLKSLSAAAAKALSKHEGELELRGSLKQKVEKYKKQGGKK